MPSIIVVTRDGQAHAVNATVGVSVMEAIRDSGQDALLALCGGCCSCATCHVYVPAKHETLFPPKGTDEDDLLDSTSHRTAGSRLSCQLIVTDQIDGVSVTIAPED